MTAEPDEPTIDQLLAQVAADRPTIEGYRIHEPLGVGGEADVYRATMKQSGFEVAVKVFRSGNPARFRGEVATLAKLNHPHIVRLLDSGVTSDRRPYLAMSLFPSSLDRRFPTAGSLTAAGVAALVTMIAEATHAANALGIIHRDIKPSNVLVGPTGDPCLSDFGLARDTNRPTVTRSGTILGSYLYMAPEQAKGDGRHATVATDVYGLGTLLYWLLTGRTPFEPAPLPELLRQIVDSPPLPLKEAHTRAGRKLAAICLKCLAKDPVERYHSAADLAAALRNWETVGGPRGPGALSRLRKWWVQRPLPVRVLSGLVLLLVCLATALGSLVWSTNKQSELDRRATALAEERSALVTQARARVAVRNALDRGWQLLRAKQDGWARPLRDALGEVYRECHHLPAPERDEVRLEARALYGMSLAWTDIEPVTGGHLNLPRSQNGVWPAVPHPGGTWIAVGTPQGPFRFEPGAMPRKPENLAAPPPGQRMPRIAFNRSGDLLAFAPATGGLQVWEGAVSRKIADLDTGGLPVLAVGFGAGVIRACRADGRVQSWGPGGWGKLTEPAGELTAARFTADGQRLAVGDATGRLRELTGERREWKVHGVRTAVQAIAWSPTGAIAAGFKEGVVVGWSADGDVVHRSVCFGHGVDRLDFSPDGSLLIASQRSEPSEMRDANTGDLLRRSLGEVAISTSGSLLSSATAGHVQQVHLRGPRVVFSLRGHQVPVGKVAWSRDGKYLASLDTRREVRVWDVTEGRLIDQFKVTVGDFFPHNAGLALSPDGTRLAYSCGGGPAATGAALIRDTRARQNCADWPLPGGYDAIAWEGGARFLLVREEFVPGTEVLQTVVRNLEPGQSPKVERVLRQARPTDTHRYLDSYLSPDGRYYVWSGPREPADQRRLEVLDVATGRSLRERVSRGLAVGSEPGLRPDRRSRFVRVLDNPSWVWVLPDEPNGRVAELAIGEEAGAAAPPGGPVMSAEQLATRWLSGFGMARITGSRTLVSECPDTMRMAVAAEDGTIFTTDLRAMAEAIDQFEASLEK